MQVWLYYIPHFKDTHLLLIFLYLEITCKTHKFVEKTTYLLTILYLQNICNIVRRELDEPKTHLSASFSGNGQNEQEFFQITPLLLLKLTLIYSKWRELSNFSSTIITQ